LTLALSSPSPPSCYFVCCRIAAPPIQPSFIPKLSPVRVVRVFVVLPTHPLRPWFGLLRNAVTAVSWHPFGSFLLSVDRAKTAVVWGDAWRRSEDSYLVFIHCASFCETYVNFMFMFVNWVVIWFFLFKYLIKTAENMVPDSINPSYRNGDQSSPDILCVRYSVRFSTMRRLLSLTRTKLYLMLVFVYNVFFLCMLLIAPWFVINLHLLNL